MGVCRSKDNTITATGAGTVTGGYTNMTKLEALVAAMRSELTAQCRLIKAGLVVLETETPYEHEAVREALLAQGQAQREACRCYNNLRACMGRMEKAAGNPAPRFYAGPVIPLNELPLQGCDCGFADKDFKKG